MPMYNRTEVPLDTPRETVPDTEPEVEIIDDGDGADHIEIPVSNHRSLKDRF